MAWNSEPDLYVDIQDDGASYGVQSHQLRYTHRNGDTTPPEVSGWYWTEDETLMDGFGRWDIYWVGSEDGRGTYSWFKYYGPIPIPKGI